MYQLATLQLRVEYGAGKSKSKVWKLGRASYSPLVNARQFSGIHFAPGAFFYLFTKKLLQHKSLTSSDTTNASPNICDKKSEHNDNNNTKLIIIALLPEITVCTINGCKSSIISE